MKLKEIYETLYGKGTTIIQRQSKYASLRGVEIEMNEIVKNINDGEIILLRDNDNNINSLDHCPYEMIYKLHYNKEKYMNQLMTYSIGDKVSIKASIINASGVDIYTTLDLILISIGKNN